MNDDALAAVIAAAQVLAARNAHAAPAAVASHWTLASRLRVTDARRARLAAPAASRWNLRGRLDG